jgi:hypothetical protein
MVETKFVEEKREDVFVTPQEERELLVTIFIVGRSTSMAYFCFIYIHMVFKW